MTLSACGDDSAPASSSSTFFAFLSGNISGLKAGNSITLQNNGADDLIINSDGGFGLPSPVKSGASYNVTVVTQPAGQTCTISNGSGTITTTLVDKITISCVTYAYNIGGTLSGLVDGRSVTLQINGGDDITLKNNGAFSFAPLLATGTTYNATVLTHPAGQRCAISKDSGTVPIGDVSDIKVSCQPNPYAIGGSVSGLITSKNITLQVNGANNFTVNTNGTFTFPTPLPSTTVYNVSVIIQPAGQTCTVDKRTGTIVSDPITDVAVVCRTWGAAELIENANAGDASHPQISIDKNGDAVAVWSQLNGTYTNIYSNRYTAAGAGSWATAERIDANNTNSAGNPQIAVDASGKGIAVWSASNGTKNNIWARPYAAATGWNPDPAAEKIIQTVNAGSADYPQVAIDGTSNAIAVWPQTDDAQTNVYANVYSASGVWSTLATPIRTNKVENAYNDPQVAMNSAGTAFAVWSESEGTKRYIYANRYLKNAGWGRAELIQNDGSIDGYSPQVAVDVGGNAIAVWSQSDGSQSTIWSNRFTPAKGWGTAEIIDTISAGNAFYPQIAVDGNGNAIAVWHQTDGVRYYVWANGYAAGTGWSNPKLIAYDNSGDATYPQIAMDANGNATAVWLQSDGARENIWANQYIAGTGWATPVLIETDNGNAAMPQIAVSSNGSAVAVWSQYDGANYNIWANELR